MANYWAIAIGINQYQNFQPLIYAQRDAQVFSDFLIESAQFAPERCRLLIDAAAPGEPTYPSRENIETQITSLCQEKLQPDDLLWIFFSGYGIHLNGHDYLMPIEGDPEAIAHTAISSESLFAACQAAPTQKIILVLDVNRSQSVLAGEGFGDETAAIAQATFLPTLLSCQPDQFSHETLALRQGLFTAALIESLRSGCVTLEQLTSNLTRRLPELSEHHWRPRQDPYPAIPRQQEYLLIVPTAAAIALGSRPRLPTPLATISPPSSSPLPPSPHSPLPTPSDDLFWKRLTTYSGIAALLLFAGVILRNCTSLYSSPTAKNNSAAIAIVPPAADAIKLEPTAPLFPALAALKNQDYEAAQKKLAAIPEAQRNELYADLLLKTHQGLLYKARTLLVRVRDSAQENQVSDFVDAMKLARLIRPDQPLYAEAQKDIDRWSQTIFDMALGKAARPLKADAPAQDIAKNYVAAIATAAYVPTDRNPLYAQAQQAIAQWSKAIYDLARARANANDLDAAVAIADLVPSNSTLYPKTQEAIASWRKQAVKDEDLETPVPARSRQIVPPAPIYPPVAPPPIEYPPEEFVPEEFVPEEFAPEPEPPLDYALPESTEPLSPEDASTEAPLPVEELPPELPPEATEESY